MSLPGLFSFVATTDGIVVRVQPRYGAQESDPEQRLWFWQYHVRIENAGGVTVQLRDRHWIITDADGARRDVMGEGVVGEQPLIAPGDSFDYVSGCALHTAGGSMQGLYGMEDPSGRRFEVTIPKFDLIVPPGLSIG